MPGTVILAITGGEVRIDSDDLDLVSRYRWHKSDQGYAVWRGIKDGKKRTIRMHRLIAKTPDNLFTDHKNRDKLDNRKSNLRHVTHKENMDNIEHKGYVWDSAKGKWMVRYKRHFYGRYDTEIEAQKAYQLAKSGVERRSKLHPRRQFLPMGVAYMKSRAELGYSPYYFRIRIKGKRVFRGYFKTIKETQEAYLTEKARIQLYQGH